MPKARINSPYALRNKLAKTAPTKHVVKNETDMEEKRDWQRM
jgi:hypothetical protein